MDLRHRSSFFHLFHSVTQQIVCTRIIIEKSFPIVGSLHFAYVCLCVCACAFHVLKILWMSQYCRPILTCNKFEFQKSSYCHFSSCRTPFSHSHTALTYEKAIHLLQMTCSHMFVFIASVLVVVRTNEQKQKCTNLFDDDLEQGFWATQVSFSIDRVCVCVCIMAMVCISFFQ